MKNEFDFGELIVEEQIEVEDIQFDVIKEVPKYESLTFNPTTEEQIKEGTFNKVTVLGDKNLLPKNILEGVKIFDVEGIVKKNSGKYVWSKYKNFIEGDPTPENTKLLLHLNNNIYDATGINLPTIYGKEVYEAGKFKDAFKFDGTNSIKIPHSSNVKFGTKDFTIAGWFYTETVKSQGFFSDRYRFNSNFWTAGTTVSMSANGKFYIELYVGVEPTTTGRKAQTEINTYVPIGEWFHLALVRASSTITLYLNGKSIFSVSVSSATLYKDSKSSFKIGSTTVKTTLSDNPDDFFVGLIDEFIIVNGSALWTSNFTPPAYAYGGNPGILEEYVVSNEENSYPKNDYDENGYYYISGIK
jgi:hypothetical protein